MAAERGDVWVIGAQNAGKSSMVNALRRVASGKSAGEDGVGQASSKDITVAPLPGTTLGASPISWLRQMRPGSVTKGLGLPP